MGRSTSPSRDRRRHVVYLTRNTEYHCRSRICVAVRDRNSGKWWRGHPALRAELQGAVGRGPLRLLRPGVGLRLLFKGGEAVLTSPVMLAGRPDRSAVLHYTSQCWSGEIQVA